jgi:predicted SnoaL-like aldol condensation-catalyzing enzyme
MQDEEGGDMGADSDLVRRLTDEVFLGGDTRAVDDLVATTFVSHDPPPGFPGNRDGLRGVAELVTGAFSDRTMDFDDFLDTTDGRVVENWAMLGTHTGDAFGIPPSGQKVRVRGMEIWRCQDGRIVEHWGTVDMSDLFTKAQG